MGDVREILKFIRDSQGLRFHFACQRRIVFVPLSLNSKSNSVMTDYEYILSECKKAHYGQWDAVSVVNCIEKLRDLTREELLRLFTSRWLVHKCEVREAVFGLLFKEQLERRAAKIRDASVDELGAMLIEKDGNYVVLARKELKERYQRLDHGSQMRIIRYFIKGTTKSDVSWGVVREKWQKRGFANPPSIFDSWKK